ncbi:MAG: hypothetical protein AB7V27_06140 [Candidatus Binatia bacterium]
MATQVIATGKWSKTLKRWQMIVAFRRPSKDGSARRPATRAAQHPDRGRSDS